jgi:hypothetical protein
MLRRLVVLVIVGAIATFLTANAVTRTVFPALGEPLVGKSGSYIIALLISLTISGIGGARVALGHRFGAIAFMLSATASGALLGFVYGGLAADKNPQVAVVGAVMGGMLMGFASWRFRTGVVAVAVAIASAVTGYGLAFWLWTMAIATLTAQQLIWGIFLSTLSLAYIGLTANSLFLAVQEIKQSAT